MKPPLTRENVLAIIVQTFRQYGYEGSSLSLLAERTGLKRSSLYHHFPGGKEQMAELALQTVLVEFHQKVLTPLQDQKLSPRERLNQAMDGLDQFYAQGGNACLIDIFSIGEIRKHFQEELALRSQSVIQEFAKVCIDAGVDQTVALQRAEDAMMNLQGSLVLSRSLNNRNLFKRCIKEMPDRLLE